MMSWQAGALLLLGGSTVLLFIGMPVAFAFLAINLGGALLYLGGDAGIEQIVRNSVVAVANFALTPIPLFVLMGEILFHTGLAVKVIEGIERLIRQVPGRLAVVAVVAGTVFSAISGSTIATTAMLGSLMLPVMLARGYNPAMATGPIMAIGAVDMLIPPSALTVLLGQSVGHFDFQAADRRRGAGPDAQPGLCRLYRGSRALNPEIGAGDRGRTTHRLGEIRAARPLCHPADLDLRRGDRRDVRWHRNPDRIGRARRHRDHGAGRRLSCAVGQALITSLRGTVTISAMILFIILGATTFSQILSFSGTTEGIVSAIFSHGLSPSAILAGMLLLLIFLGIFVDQVSMMLITLPVFMPIVQRLGIDMIWFGFSISSACNSACCCRRTVCC